MKRRKNDDNSKVILRSSRDLFNFISGGFCSDTGRSFVSAEPVHQQRLQGPRLRRSPEELGLGPRRPRHPSQRLQRVAGGQNS